MPWVLSCWESIPNTWMQQGGAAWPDGIIWYWRHWSMRRDWSITTPVVWSIPPQNESGETSDAKTFDDIFGGRRQLPWTRNLPHSSCLFSHRVTTLSEVYFYSSPDNWNVELVVSCLAEDFVCKKIWWIRYKAVPFQSSHKKSLVIEGR
jgi:hypothetical protein